MKKMLVLSVMAVFALSSMAFAAVDPDPDGMGIYFDTSADTYCLAEATPGVQIPVYIMLTNPSTANPVLSWEARVTYEGDALFGTSGGNVQWTFTNAGTNVGDAVDLIVGTGAEPVAMTGEATILASANLAWFATGGYAVFSIGRTTGSLTFSEGAGYVAEIGVPIPCQHIFGTWGAPSAWINGECAGVANEDMSWGSVKSLY